jgi:histidyl-tRNA synthetase
MQDILPPGVAVWQRLESLAAEVFEASGFRELRPPVLEYTGVFARSIGETSDIVEKEMYTFEDRGGRSVTLRPECTAPIVRAYVERSLQTLPSPQKFYYRGPMFRYERPQKGRLRQFHQIGAEAFGQADPRMDAEVVAMLARFLRRAGLPGLSVELNSIGCVSCRPAYREALLGYYGPMRTDLCPDCDRRYDQNPLRLLDCKAARCVEARRDAPLVTDYLCQRCRDHYGELKRLLEILGVSFVENPRMVRGLDYYTGTTFEVTSEHLGAQNAVAAGGRYDLLVEEFGGPPTPAIGFAIGMERLVALVADAEPEAARPRLFIAALGDEPGREALRLAEDFRERGVWAELGHGGSLKSQLRRAGRLGARHVLILGDDELRQGVVGWKDMDEGTDGQVPVGEVLDRFAGPEEPAPRSV